MWARPPTLTRWLVPHTEHRTPTRNLAMARRFHCPLLLQLLHVIHNVQHISGFFYDTLLHNCTVKVLFKSMFLLNLHYRGKKRPQKAQGNLKGTYKSSSCGFLCLRTSSSQAAEEDIGGVPQGYRMHVLHSRLVYQGRAGHLTGTEFMYYQGRAGLSTRVE